MSGKILVAYATGAGSTKEVAEAVGKVLSESGAAVDVQPVKAVSDVSPYAAVVVGSAARAGKWLPAATKFVQEHGDALRNRPVAYFTVCLTMGNDTPENRKTVAAYNAPAKAVVKPVDEGLFAGALSYARLSFFPRLIMKRIIKAPEGDFRNWEAVRTWAASLPQKLAPST